MKFNKLLLAQLDKRLNNWSDIKQQLDELIQALLDGSPKKLWGDE